MIDLNLEKMIHSGTVDYLSRLLSFALRKGADDVALRLVNKYGTLDLVASAPVDELVGVPGMTENAAILLKLSIALTAKRVTDGVQPGARLSDEELKRYLIALFLGTSVETVYMLALDSSDRLISTEYMGEGVVNSSDVYPRKLVERAVKLGASRVILAHNHPRGNAEPSADDVTATARLDAVFKSAGITLLGHYTVAERNVGAVPIVRQ